MEEQNLALTVDELERMIQNYVTISIDVAEVIVKNSLSEQYEIEKISKFVESQSVYIMLRDKTTGKLATIQFINNKFYFEDLPKDKQDIISANFQNYFSEKMPIIIRNTMNAILGNSRTIYGIVASELKEQLTAALVKMDTKAFQMIATGAKALFDGLFECCGGHYLNYKGRQQTPEVLRKIINDEINFVPGTIYRNAILPISSSVKGKDGRVIGPWGGNRDVLLLAVYPNKNLLCLPVTTSDSKDSDETADTIRLVDASTGAKRKEKIKLNPVCLSPLSLSYEKDCSLRAKGMISQEEVNKLIQIVYGNFCANQVIEYANVKDQNGMFKEEYIKEIKTNDKYEIEGTPLFELTIRNVSLDAKSSTIAELYNSDGRCVGYLKLTDFAVYYYGNNDYSGYFLKYMTIRHRTELIKAEPDYLVELIQYILKFYTRRNNSSVIETIANIKEQLESLNIGFPDNIFDNGLNLSDDEIRKHFYYKPTEKLKLDIPDTNGSSAGEIVVES